MLTNMLTTCTSMTIFVTWESTGPNPSMPHFIGWVTILEDFSNEVDFMMNVFSHDHFQVRESPLPKGSIFRDFFRFPRSCPNIILPEISLPWIPLYTPSLAISEDLPSLQQTFSPLKMDGWKMILSFWGPAYFQKIMLVSGSVPFPKLIVPTQPWCLRYDSVANAS